MPCDYAYFPGCSLRGTGIAYHESLAALCRLLDLRLHEVPDWNCCGATSYSSIDEISAYELSGRNLSLARQTGLPDLVAPCSACYLVLRKTQDYVRQYASVSRYVRTSLERQGLPQLDGVRVRHPLEVLFNDVGLERIRNAVVRRWRGGRVACYYGCQLVRPYQEADRSYNPMRMDELLQAAGVPTVPFPLKTKCCGGTLTSTIHEVGVRLNYILLKEAARQGAEAIVTACPLCQLNLDAYQGEIRAYAPEVPDMPALYFTQILAWVLGADPHALGLERAIAGRELILRWFHGKIKGVESYV